MNEPKTIVSDSVMRAVIALLCIALLIVLFAGCQPGGAAPGSFTNGGVAGEGEVQQASRFSLMPCWYQYESDIYDVTAWLGPMAPDGSWFRISARVSNKNPAIGATYGIEEIYSQFYSYPFQSPPPNTACWDRAPDQIREDWWPNPPPSWPPGWSGGYNMVYNQTLENLWNGSPSDPWVRIRMHESCVGVMSCSPGPSHQWVIRDGFNWTQEW